MDCKRILGDCIVGDELFTMNIGGGITMYKIDHIINERIICGDHEFNKSNGLKMRDGEPWIPTIIALPINPLIHRKFKLQKILRFIHYHLTYYFPMLRE